jgi:hypothetical protein
MIVTAAVWPIDRMDVHSVLAAREPTHTTWAAALLTCRYGHHSLRQGRQCWVRTSTPGR